MAIATTAEYKTYAGISGSTDDTVIGVLVAAANDLITRYCNRTSFDTATYTERHSAGPNQKSFTLRAYPITSITSVKLLTGTSASSTLDSDTYTFDAASGILYLWNAGGTQDEYGMSGFGPEPLGMRLGTAFTETSLQYEVVYVGGYASNAMPDGLKFALYRVVDSMWASRRRDPALKSESIGAYSYTLGDAASGGGGLSAEVQAMLMPYRREGT